MSPAEKYVIALECPRRRAALRSLAKARGLPWGYHPSGPTLCALLAAAQDVAIGTFAEALGSSYGYARRIAHEMVQKGYLYRTGPGVYRMPEKLRKILDRVIAVVPDSRAPSEVCTRQGAGLPCGDGHIREGADPAP